MKLPSLLLAIVLGAGFAACDKPTTSASDTNPNGSGSGPAKSSSSVGATPNQAGDNPVHKDAPATGSGS